MGNEDREKEIDTYYTDDVVCPYCGCKHQMDCDFHTGDNEYNCAECERDFVFEPSYSVSFCSWTMEEELEQRIKNADRTRRFYEQEGKPESAATYAAQIENYRKRLDALKVLEDG